MNLPLKLIYLSPGNLPSKWAHSVQIAKMSQAFSEKVEEFELVTSGDIWSVLVGKEPNFREWYGLHRDLKITRLPLHLRKDNFFSQDYHNPNFLRLAVLYASLNSPSLVYTRTPRIFYISTKLKLKLPIIIELHDHFVAHHDLNFFCKDNLLGVVTISQKLAERYINQGLSPEKVLVEYDAVDLQMFSLPLSKESARQKVSLSNQAPIIVYTGHLYDYKGIPTILKVAHLMPESTFVLVGGWENDVERVKEACRTAELHNVRLIGHVPHSQLTPYLYVADILILPTSKQWDKSDVTSPLKLFDYMASKRPIVASALPNITTVLKNNSNALLAEPDNPISFKEAIERLLKNPSLGSAIAERAFQDVQQHTWENRAERILQFAAKRLSAYRKQLS
jgi:glycosyltransferase involved in cell wall biosynthesis